MNFSSNVLFLSHLVYPWFWFATKKLVTVPEGQKVDVDRITSNSSKPMVYNKKKDLGAINIYEKLPETVVPLF